VLAECTDQGIRTIEASSQRASQFEEMARRFGCVMREVDWTPGRYDIMAIVDAKDDQALTAFGLALNSAGNGRTANAVGLQQERIRLDHRQPALICGQSAA